ncbi:Ig-like domain-containing protein [Akkermansiaceae bacterium]|nr:Ig-like domain-containing protein [Akkermansiaceae bacterium]MDB4537680.1 Ig-like domain-containing protein [Akkermansiaceae bacterium]
MIIRKKWLLPLALSPGLVQAELVGQLGILSSGTLTGNNPTTGLPWQAGDKYRLIFHTSARTTAGSGDIETYNTWVQGLANASTVYDIGADDGAIWKAVGSTDVVDARDNTSTNYQVDGAGHAIYLLDGSTLIANDYADLWDGSIQHTVNLTEIGTEWEHWPFTGSYWDGTKAPGHGSSSYGALGDGGEIHQGQASDADNWVWRVWTSASRSDDLPMYALSEPLTILDDAGGMAIAGTNPVDDATRVLITEPLTMTFSKSIVLVGGNITLRNITDGIDVVIPVGDSRVSVEGVVLTIDPQDLQWGKNYAVRIDAEAIDSTTGDSFAGIADDTTWNFETNPGEPFFVALSELKDHINGVITLSAVEIAMHKLTLDLEKERLDESAASITAAFDLVECYDDVVGPLWVARGDFSRNSQPDDLDWTIFHVMQYIMDEVYNAPTLAAHEELLDGFKFGSVADFPGEVDPPVDPNVSHTALINGSFPDTFGRDTQHWTWPARKPTGCYLAPGTIATVTVPPALVGKGYQVRIGAHSWDMESRSSVRRLDRATLLYDLDATTIKVASPYGGGIYLEVPFRSDAGVVNVEITGAVRSPYFSAKSFHRTSLDEWLDTERHHQAPWADFQSEKFMMQVPTSWIYAHPDPVSLMEEWDSAMDAMNDLMGFPRDRGKETMYPQVDLIFRVSVHAPGYPSINNTDNPNNDRGGYRNHYLTRGPRNGADIEFHEQGHAYLFPKFGGESESNVNLPHVSVMNRAYDVDLDEAFASSLGFEGNPHRTLDNTAVAWMCVFNFAPREVPMASGEKAYQLKGHAKYVDIVRLFGWEGLDAYWYSFNDDMENGRSSPGSTDGKLLRLCQSVGEDIRPLLHFWGIHPGSPTSLAADVEAEGLTPSAEIYDLLLHYKSLVPANNDEFRTFTTNWWGKKPSIGGYWTEREHARQWDTEELFGEGDQQRPNGEMYVEASAVSIEARVQELIDLYFPDGRPMDDYGDWAAMWPALDLSDPEGDFDRDGRSNNDERVFGTDPTNGASSDPVTFLVDGSGFSYTRRDDALSTLTFSVWKSTSLEPGSWIEDVGAQQIEGAMGTNFVETVSVTLSEALRSDARIFVQIRAN